MLTMIITIIFSFYQVDDVNVNVTNVIQTLARITDDVKSKAIRDLLVNANPASREDYVNKIWMNKKTVTQGDTEKGLLCFDA